MNEAQRRAWLALGLGPRWLWRDADIDDDAQAVALDDPESEAASIDRLEAVPDADDRSTADGPVPERSPGDSPAEDRPVPAVDLDDSAIGRRGAAIAACGWPELRETVAACQACGLWKSRSNTVFGVGDESADWFVLGEAPGAEEDRRGEPFVGRAGQLLDAMLAAVGKSRSSGARRSGVFIANVLKCRPPANRDPSPDEAARCEPFLQRQIELVSPKLILVVGRVAAQALLGTEASLASLRGRVHAHRAGGREIPVVVTYHPAYLLRKPEDKAKAWVDLQLAMRQG